MPRGKQLSEEEKGKIQAYHEEGLSNREISRRLKRSSSVVDNFLKLGSKYAQAKRPGRTPLVSDRDKREIKRLAVKENYSANKIRAEMSLDIGTRRVQQIMKQDLKLTYRKRCGKPGLKPQQKMARLRFAEKYRFWDDEWKSVVFSDEKKLNLDGPDGLDKHWTSQESPGPMRQRRNFGGGSLMVWAGMHYRGTTPICFVSTKMDSDYYIQLLDEVLITFVDDNCGPEFVFQQDNASIHRSKKTLKFLGDRNIPLLDWPAISPDLNPIENLWSTLATKVYQHGRQFNSVKDLKAVIQEEWAKIDPSHIHSLINSMPRRLEDVIRNKGGQTSY